MLKIWTYIIGHDYEDEMKERLLEELGEMSGTCSSGFASRLINTISGFGEFNLRISWVDQIISNFKGRLNYRIRHLEDEDYRDDILEEMTIDSNKYELRGNFLKFFRDNMLNIREELYEEFKDHLTDTDFDLYTRRAIIVYTGANF